MIFHSLDFLIFFLVVFSFYWMLRKRSHQNWFLLVASYFFYSYVHYWFGFLLLATTVMDFCCARAIGRFPHRKKLFLWLSLVFSLGILGFFKYYGFFVENVSLLLHSLGLGTFTNNLHIFLPVGISFYTFQSIGYIVDVYRGHTKPARNFIDYGVFISLFPQLVAGPIERSHQLLPQVQRARRFDTKNAVNALVLILWGFFKKLVIADNVAVTCNKIFGLEDPNFALIWTGVFAFAVQIFADFSAYTDIARGTSRLLGFELMRNFEHPYISRSPGEFWRRWHISLSNWFRDYVYIPLGGSRAGKWRTAWNVIITFFLSGLWHGAQWNYVIWGLWYAVLLVIYRLVHQIVPARVCECRWLFPLQWAIMFVFINIGWMFFRETNLPYIIEYLRLSPWNVTPEQLGIATFLFWMTFLYGMPIWIHHLGALLPEKWVNLFHTQVTGWRLFSLQTLLGLFFYVSILLLRAESTSDFIYFQF